MKQNESQPASNAEHPMTNGAGDQVHPQNDWSDPKPEVLAEPTWWPAALALGSTLLAWGLITSRVIVAIGVVVFAGSLAGWIGDIRHEQRKHGNDRN